jgi:tRNA-dihydrouridine synthase
MPLSDPTLSILQEIDVLSGRKLLRRDDLGVLIDCAQRGNRKELLADLAFQAKFAWKSRVVMQRIGQGAEGYDRLATEFTSAVEEVRRHLGALLEGCPGAEALRQRTMAMTPQALEELLSLMNDLTWYKNWLIDRR